MSVVLKNREWSITGKRPYFGVCVDEEEIAVFKEIHYSNGDILDYELILANYKWTLESLKCLADGLKNLVDKLEKEMG